ncbi:putative cuticle protein [Ixodes scapularis]
MLAASFAGDVPPGLGFARVQGGAPFTYGTRHAFPGVAFAAAPQVASARIHVPASGVVYGAPRPTRIYGGPGPIGLGHSGPAGFAGPVPAAVAPPYAGLQVAPVIGGRPAVVTGFVAPAVAKINPVPAIVKTVVAEPAYGPHPYSFGYDTVDEFGNKQYRHETSDANNAKKGSYGYTDTNGIYRQVDYIADANGFRATVRTNEPGTAPSAPAGVLYDAKPVVVKPAAVVKPLEAAAPASIHTAPSLVAGPTLTRLNGPPAAFSGRLVAKVVPLGRGPLLAGPVAPREHRWDVFTEDLGVSLDRWLLGCRLDLLWLFRDLALRSQVTTSSRNRQSLVRDLCSQKFMVLEAVTWVCTPVELGAILRDRTPIMSGQLS